MDYLNSKFVALLRGINVGGKNVIRKDELRQAFEDLGYSSVLTYIQSGNILFRGVDPDPEGYIGKIEVILSERFHYKAQCIVYSEKQYRDIIENAPDTWGKDEDNRHRIIFLLGNATPEEVMVHLGTPERGVETVTAGPGVIYSSVSKQHLSKSVLRKFPSNPSYQQVSLRNHNTVFKLRDLLEKMV